MNGFPKSTAREKYLPKIFYCAWSARDFLAHPGRSIKNGDARAAVDRGPILEKRFSESTWEYQNYTQFSNLGSFLSRTNRQYPHKKSLEHVDIFSSGSASSADRRQFARDERLPPKIRQLSRRNRLDRSFRRMHRILRCGGPGDCSSKLPVLPKMR